jgi:hypothetical protein
MFLGSFRWSIDDACEAVSETPLHDAGEAPAFSRGAEKGMAQIAMALSCHPGSLDRVPVSTAFDSGVYLA